MLFKSTDRGEQWIPISTFPSRWISSLIIDPLNTQILYGGDGEHVFKSIDGGQSWTNSSAGLLGNLNSFSLVISPTNSQILYVRGAPDIFKTVDGGLTWVRINPGPRELFTQGTLVSPLAIDPRSPETLYSGYGDRGFLKSSDGGMQWSAHNTGLVATTISGLATTVADSRTVYAWSTSPPRLYVSTDGGKQWSDRSGAFNYSFYPDHVPPSVVVDSTDPQTLYIRTFSGVYRSSDGGSFLLPYGIGRTEEVEKALFLRQWGVPFDALAYVFGRNAMFWYRAWRSFGRPNLVGTTVKQPSTMPQDLVADEKITWLAGAEVVVPTTVGGGCVLGITVAEQATSPALQTAYGEFKTEATHRFSYVPRALRLYRWVSSDARRVAPALSPPHLGALFLALHPETHRALSGRLAHPSPRSGVVRLSRSDESPIRPTPAPLGRVGARNPRRVPGADHREDDAAADRFYSCL